MMTKKDFIALADTIRDHNSRPPGGRQFSHMQLETLALFCHSRNPQFKCERWLGYIHGECGPNGGVIRKPQGGSV